MTDRRSKIIAAGLLLLPIVLVKMSAFIFGTAPAMTQAAVPQPAQAQPIAATSITQVEPTSVQVLAAKHVAWLRDLPFANSPLFHTEIVAPLEVVQVDQAVEETDFIVDLIMATGGRDIAVINGQVCHIGDELGATGWHILSIDSPNRAIVIHKSKDGSGGGGGGDEDAVRTIEMRP